MAALRELFASFTTTFDGRPLEAGTRSVDALVGRLKGLAGALAGSAIVGGIAALTRSVIVQGDELATSAERLGLGTQALQQWEYAANLADVSAEEFSGGLRILQKNLFDASSGGGDAAANFAKVGVSLGDLRKGDLDAVLTKAADGFSQLQNPIERVALAQKLLGRSGTALLPLLSRGSAGVAELKEEFIKLGGGLDDETIRAASDADDAFKKFKFSLRSLLASAVLPLITLATRGAKVLGDLVARFTQWTKGTNAVRAALLLLGTVAAVVAFKLLIAFAPLILSTLAWAAAIAAAVLVLDEIITTLQGGDSILRRWIDDIFGLGTTDEIIKALSETWDSLSEALKTAWQWMKENVIPSARDVAAAFEYVGATIKFVVDQFRHLSEFTEGVKKIGRDIGIQLGITKPTADETKFAKGAEGFGSASQANTQAGVANGPTVTGGLFAGFSQLSSSPRTAVPTTPPGFIGPPPPPGNTITNQVTVQVAANAKPDPALANHIKRAVQDGLDDQNRKALAAVQGS